LIVTYHLMCGTSIEKVDHLNPEGILPLDVDVRLPVQVRAFSTKNGAPMYSLSLRLDHEETFDDLKETTDIDSFHVRA
jgi:hypothetical protein